MYNQMEKKLGNQLSTGAMQGLKEVERKPCCLLNFHLMATKIYLPSQKKPVMVDCRTYGRLLKF